MFKIKMSEEDFNNQDEDDEDHENFHNEDDNKEHGIPCPIPNTIPSVEAKPLVLRCVICKENQIQTVNFPCMHACFCVNCASPSLNHSNTCPQCRTIYMHISLLYICSSDPTDEDIEHIQKKHKNAL
jgi:hypothetical protein